MVSWRMMSPEAPLTRSPSSRQPRQDQNPCLIVCQLLLALPQLCDWSTISLLLRGFWCDSAADLVFILLSAASPYWLLCLNSLVDSGCSLWCDSPSKRRLQAWKNAWRRLAESRPLDVRWSSVHGKSGGNSGVKDSVEELQIWRLCSNFQRKPPAGSLEWCHQGPVEAFAECRRLLIIAAE